MPDSSPPPEPSPTTTPAGTYLSVELCSRHGFAMLAMMATPDDSGFGGGTRLLGPKSCCPERREVARWRVSPDDLARIAGEFRAPSAPPAPAPAMSGQQQDQRHAGSTMKNQPQVQVLSRDATGLPTEDLDALGRLACDAIAATATYSASWEKMAWASDYVGPFDAQAFIAQCTPERVAQLVAVAREAAALREAATRVLDYWPIWYADRENDAAEFHLRAGILALAARAGRPTEETDG